ncbi:MAG: S-adenosylmethionine:tRNA ribosyltransferase-isomerase [Bacteroidetes bacterium]|nr:S-adenosylmethionine:tRNA ribosyltransferase-isomerase [Bacteroidota bacterium]
MIPEQFKNIKISDFDFAFQESCIAQKPLTNRDESRLLHYKNGKIKHLKFKNLPQILNSNNHLILNNAKVIPARLNFYRKSGAKIEIFILEPENSVNTVEKALSDYNSSVWKCMIGNLKKWKINEVLSTKVNDIKIEASLISEQNQIVKFMWNDNFSFGEIIELAGKTPLPPYIKRESDENDKITYQTVFAKNPGAVAAPTAGLHFTEKILLEISKKNICTDEITLYVSAGTFAPVKTVKLVDHAMHAEMFSVSKNTIENLKNSKHRIAVGTTSLRTLESLYWIGVKLLKNEENPLFIEKLYPYFFSKLPYSWIESLEAITLFIHENSNNDILAKTEIMIMPGYNFSSVNGLITNFHYPNTTLIMLVAAFIGKDWQKVYKTAIEQNYRFLSYGDCCFFEL